MFGNNESNKSLKKSSKKDITGLNAANRICEGTTIEGEISSDGDIRIDGNLKGIIRSKAKVVIGTNGKVEGDISCNNADILGKVEGTLHVKDILFLKNSARINGDIHTSKFVVEPGAVFNGNCTMGKDNDMKAVKNEERLVQKQRQQETAAVQ